MVYYTCSFPIPDLFQSHRRRPLMSHYMLYMYNRNGSGAPIDQEDYGFFATIELAVEKLHAFSNKTEARIEHTQNSQAARYYLYERGVWRQV